MTPLQTAEVRAGEIRIRLSEIGGMAELTEETRAELDTLRTEYTDVERRQIALQSANQAGRPLKPAAPREPSTARYWRGPTWAPFTTPC